MPNINEKVKVSGWSTYTTNLVNANQNLNSIITIWNNPEMYTSRAYKYINKGNDPATAVPVVDNFITASIINTDKAAALYVGNRCVAQFGSVLDLTNVATSTNVAIGDKSLAAHVASITNTIDQIQSLLSGYNGWYDAYNYCSRSCQLACQSGCQVACQGCITAQCHDQNCGMS